MKRRAFFGFLAAPFFAPLVRLLPNWAAPVPVPEILSHSDCLAIFRELYGSRVEDRETGISVMMKMEFEEECRRRRLS